MSNGGSLNFQFSFRDKNCDSICKSNQVQTGCKFGFKCKFNSKCQNDNCLCNMEMSCNRKTSGGNRNLVKNLEIVQYLIYVKNTSVVTMPKIAIQAQCSKNLKKFKFCVDHIIFTTSRLEIYSLLQILWNRI